MSAGYQQYGIFPPEKANKGTNRWAIWQAHDTVSIPDWICRADPQGSLKGYLASLFGQLDRDLDDPVTYRLHGDIWEVDVLGCIRYQFDSSTKEIFAGSLGPGGAYQQGDYVVELLHPLCTAACVDFLFESRSNYEPPQIFDIEEEYVDFKKYMNWLGSFVYQQLLRDVRFQNLRRYILPECFDLFPDLVHIALRSRVLTEGRVLVSDCYQQVWQNERVFRQVDRENPQLLPLIMLALVTERISFKQDPVKELKECLLEYGLTQAGWRYLCRYGCRMFRTIWNNESQGEDRWTYAVELINLLQNAALPPPPNRIAIDMLLEVDEYANVHWYELPWQLVSLLLAETRECARRGNMAGIREEFRAIIMWIDEEQWSMDKQQFKAGWRSLQKRVNAWFRKKSLDKNVVEQHWEPVIQPFIWKSWQVTPVTSYKALLAEGVHMRNCVADLVDDCKKGELQIISIRKQVGHKPIANVGLYMHEENQVWFIGETKGIANARYPISLQPLLPILSRAANQPLDEEQNRRGRVVGA